MSKQRRSYVVHWDGVKATNDRIPDHVRAYVEEVLDLHVTPGWYEITEDRTPHLLLPTFVDLSGSA